MLRFLHIDQVIDSRCHGFPESVFEDSGLSVMSRHCFVLLLRLKFVLFLFSCLLCLCLYRDALLLRLVECCCRFCR